MISITEETTIDSKSTSGKHSSLVIQDVTNVLHTSVKCALKKTLATEKVSNDQVACNEQEVSEQYLTAEVVKVHGVKRKISSLDFEEYEEDIVKHQRITETQTAKPYLHKRTHINDKMRAILVNWLVDVHDKCELSPVTLHMAVAILDRYCEMVDVKRNQLQLVGVTALFVASKYEDKNSPTVQQCVYVTSNAYTVKEVLRMESKILFSLGFRIAVPNTLTFLCHDLVQADASLEAAHFAHFLSERALLHEEILQFVPSKVSAACTLLALLKEGKSAPYSEYSLKELESCKKVIEEIASSYTMTKTNRRLDAVERKFRKAKSFKVAQHIVKHQVMKKTTH